MSTRVVAELLAAFASALAAEELLFDTPLRASAEAVRVAIEAIRDATGSMIEDALAVPATAGSRAELLGQAVVFEGDDGRLVALASRAMAATVPGGSARECF